MAFTVPNPTPQRQRYINAKTIRDELGKGQEILRVAELTVGPVAQNATVIYPIFVPEVDVEIVGITLSTRGIDDGDLVNVIALATAEDYETAPGATNKLITEVATAANAGEDTLARKTLLGLNGNRVRAGQPVCLHIVEDNSAAIPAVYVKVSYILADDARSY